MGDVANDIVSVNIEDELKQSYLDYAMSVLSGRALPDVRDGLKPVHRRVLYAMHELNNDWNKPYKKSARVVGDVIGKYHPHGETAVYDATVRMAQLFSLRYPLVDGQGNFGSIDGDPAAAMRYTEVRRQKIAHALMADLDKDSVSFVPNYDDTETLPSVFPARIPNLLINGSSGIAVGMATNIAPHNLGEVIDACLALIDNPELSMEDLCQHVQGPDFPTAAIIHGRAGFNQAYRTGRGRVCVRAKTQVESLENGRELIIVTELPYQVNKAVLIEKIAILVREKRLQGITELRDESDKDGMRIVIGLKRGEISEVVLNQLFKLTQLQSFFGINMVALVDGVPQLLNLKQILELFIKHRREVVTRRTLHDLNKARNKAHVLEGLAIALANIDEVIAMIKVSKSPSLAKQALLNAVWQPGQVKQMLDAAGVMLIEAKGSSAYGLLQDGYHLSPTQAQAILDLKLHRLTGLEQDKITKEFCDLLERIASLEAILKDVARLLEVIKTELGEDREQFADARRTQIVESQYDLTVEDLIADEPVVLTLSHTGYIKRQSLDFYKAQHRGGMGRSAASTKDEDVVDKLLIANTHDTVLCFSDCGKVYWLKVYQIPSASPQSRGRPIVNLLPLGSGEKISTILSLRTFDEDRYVFMATAKGFVKKVSLSHFSRPRSSGIIALALAEDDHLIGAELSEGKSDIFLFSDGGKAIRFSEKDVRATGRTARGVRGIKLRAGQRVVSLLVACQQEAFLITTMHGYGKRTLVNDFRTIGRGGQGVVAIPVNERNGKVIAVEPVVSTDEVMLISNQGTLVRIPVEQVSVYSRSAQGVRLIKLRKQECLVGIAGVKDLGFDDEANS